MGGRTPHTPFSVVALNYCFLRRDHLFPSDKTLMVFSFAVNSHSRSRYLLVFSTFSIQFKKTV